MSRAVLVLDRVVAFVVGLVLLAVGVAAVLWWLGTFASWPARLDTSGVRDLTGQTWWPWAIGLVGVVLILLGLRWLVGHLPARGASQLKLPGSDASGRLVAQISPVARAAAEVFEQAPGVRSASATIREARGQLIVRLNATIEQQADLGAVAAAADQVSADLARVLQRDDIHCQVNLGVAQRARAMPRVG